MKRRVVLTGLGAVTAIGHDVPSFWEAALAGQTRVERVPDAWHRFAELISTVWSPLPEIDYEARGLNRMDLLQRDPVATMAILAASEAIENAGIETKQGAGRQHELVGFDPERTAVSMGTGLGGTESIVTTLIGHAVTGPRTALEGYLADNPDEVLQSIAADLDGPSRVSPLAVAMIMANSPASSISIRWSITGPSNTFTSACAAGTVAIGQAFNMIRSGGADLVLAGGSESMNDPYGAAFRSFDGARTLASSSLNLEDINRPFDNERSGFLFSEGGAAVLVLEDLDSALRRDADIVAEVVGFAETSDAHNPVATAPDGKQIERAFRLAVADAGGTVADVDYVNAHGTGTVLNDDVESAMLERVVGTGAIVNSTKSLIGHTLGASGAIEAVVAALSIRDQRTHPSRNLTAPIRDLAFATDSEPQQIEVALSESFAFGGHNAALVLRRFTP